MILCRQISDVIANENARYKRNELEFNFNLYEENRKYSHMSLNITWYKELSIDKHDNNVQNTWWAHVGTGQNW